MNAAREQQHGFVLEVDIHGMHARAAKYYLQQVLARAARDRNIREVCVIHGCHTGTVLRDMVRRELKSPFIKKKMLSLNDGQTSLLLNKP